MRKQEQRNYIIARELDIPAGAGIYFQSVFDS